MKITINAAQGAALVWSIIALALALIVVLPSGFVETFFGPTAANYLNYWYIVVALFFAVYLIVTLPVYLAIAVWELAKDPEEDPEQLQETAAPGQDKARKETEAEGKGEGQCTRVQECKNYAPKETTDK